METVVVEGLSQHFRAKQKAPGFGGSLRALVSPRFSDVEAVAGISFSACRGEVVGFIGPNGAGKSTTLKMLTGIRYPSGGRAPVMGLTPWRERRRLSFQVASVFGQRSQLWYHLPPADSFCLLPRIYKLDQREFKKRLERLEAQFELSPFLNVPVEQLRNPSPAAVLAVIGFGVLAVALARLVFAPGIRRYQSGNLVELRG